MDITAEVVDEQVRTYPDVQPLATVEEEHLEMLPESFASGNYGWRDAEWVVRWYYRRFLGAYPDADRRAVEDAYGGNSFEDVHEAISAAVEAREAAEKLNQLTTLVGVDVPVGSAFLQFLHPDRYIVLGPREWAVLREAGAVSDDYPCSPTIREYERYLATCRSLTGRIGRDLWDLYRALWVLGGE